MKKILLCIVCVLTLTGCLGFGDEQSVATGLSLQDREDFSILIPSSWQEIDQGKAPVPITGDLVLAYSSSEERQGYFNNIVILELEKSQQASSLSLMEKSISSLKTQIDDYTIISNETSTFADEQEGLFLTYRGKYNTSTPEAIYVQTAKSCSNADYYITISLAEVLDDYGRYQQILQTFRCS